MILVEKLLLQDRRYHHFQSILETKAYNDSAAYQRLRTYCTTLERQNSEFEGYRHEYDKAMRTATESCRVLTRDLALERTKVQDLEARLNELYPSIRTLLENMAQPHSTAKENALQHDLCYQRELVHCLKSTIRDQEEKIEKLGQSLESVYKGNLIEPGSQPSTRSEGKTDGSMEVVTEPPLLSAAVEQ